MVRQRSKTSFVRPLLLLVATLLLAVITIAALELTDTTHVFHKQPPQSKKVVTAGDPVAPSPKDNTNSSSKESSGTEPAPASQQGGATDTHGTTAPATDPGQWVTSDTGYITVKSPVANSKLQDGATLAGTTKASQVNYRLTDNAVGVIAQGQLTVTDGKFSGTLHFTPKGTGGRLDVFSTDASGTEYNEIQINVSF